jgi:hypothetical protein
MRMLRMCQGPVAQLLDSLDGDACAALTASPWSVAWLRPCCQLQRLFDALRGSSLQLPVTDRQPHESRKDRP